MCIWAKQVQTAVSWVSWPFICANGPPQAPRDVSLGVFYLPEESCLGLPFTPMLV